MERALRRCPPRRQTRTTVSDTQLVKTDWQQAADDWQYANGDLCPLAQFTAPDLIRQIQRRRFRSMQFNLSKLCAKLFQTLGFTRTSNPYDSLLCSHEMIFM